MQKQCMITFMGMQNSVSWLNFHSVYKKKSEKKEKTKEISFAKTTSQRGEQM